MKLKITTIVTILVVLAGCSPAEDTTTAKESAVSANELFDSAVQQMTTAYFSNVPESATALGIPEEVVPGTGARMMDRSVAGNAAEMQRWKQHLPD